MSYCLPAETTTSEITGTVLIVDDVLEAAEELSEALQNFGIETRIATTANQAKKMVLYQPDICAVITDFYLRKGGAGTNNGLKLLEDLQSRAPERNLKCVVISGDPDVLVDCTLIGAQRFLGKPVAPESLIEMLTQKLPDLRNNRDTDTVRKLHQIIMTQSRAITRLTDTIKHHESRAMKISNHVDHLTSAAMLVSHQVTDADRQDVVSMMEYIVAEGAAAKGLAKARPDPVAAADTIPR
ncbi:MAG: response regulator [Pseudomonadota bacterium]